MRKKKVVCMLLMIGALAFFTKFEAMMGEAVNVSSLEIEWFSL